MDETVLHTAADIAFPASTLTGYALTALIYLILPAAACLLMRRKQALMVLPVIIGAVFYLLFTRFNDIIVGLFLSSYTPAMQSVAALETIAVFEETARFLALRAPLSYDDRTRTAVCYGIGHAGAECLLRALRYGNYLRYGLRFQENGLTSFIAEKSAEKAQSVTERLYQISANTLDISILQMLNACGVFLFHIALSVLVLHGIKYGRPGKYLLGAVGLHYADNSISYIMTLLLGSGAAGCFCLLFQAFAVWLVLRITENREPLRDFFSREPECKKIPRSL